MESKLQGIDHVTLLVADVARTARWYQTSFQCELIEESPTRAVLKFENLKLVLALPSQQAQHIAFVRSDASTFGELAPTDDGRASTYLSDPSGNLVEIINE